MEMLKALNSARLRQRNLQMTTATLRVLNPPMFPMNAQPTNRMMILLGAFLLTFALTALYFFIIELLDRTLRDRMRSERITKVPVMGCFPKGEHPALPSFQQDDCRHGAAPAQQGFASPFQGRSAECTQSDFYGCR